MQRERDWPLRFNWKGIEEKHLSDAGIPNTGTVRLRAARCSLVAELLIAAQSGRSWVSYSRRPDYYARQTRYHAAGFTLRYVLRLVDELVELGMIEEIRAAPGQRGWQSRMAASSILLDRCPRSITFVFDPIEVVRLKDPNGALIDYVDTEDTARDRKQVETLNASLSSVRIDPPWIGSGAGQNVVWVDDIPILINKVAGYRVFNGSWQLGGRFYGPFWQTLPKSRRAQLKINGDPVAEPDFPHLHPRLLYAAQGVQLGADAYTLSGLEGQRDLIKVGWQIMINCLCRADAVRALADQLGGQFRYRCASQLLSAIEFHHDAIRGAFYSGVGLRLQRIDADLMMKVVRRCLAAGIVVLPVHDSFIVASKNDQRLEEFMNDELTHTLKSLKL